MELIDKYKKWRRDNGEVVSGSESGDKEKPTQKMDSKDFWDLNTIRGAPAELAQPSSSPELAREDSKTKVSSRSGDKKKPSSRSHREGRERKDKREKSSVLFTCSSRPNLL